METSVTYIIICRAVMLLTYLPMVSFPIETRAYFLIPELHFAAERSASNSAQLPFRDSSQTPLMNITCLFGTLKVLHINNNFHGYDFNRFAQRDGE